MSSLINVNRSRTIALKLQTQSARLENVTVYYV